MKGVLLSILDNHQGRTNTWCVVRDGARLHINAVYDREGLLNPKYTLRSVWLSGCGCNPWEEVPSSVWREAEKLLYC
jgi:hypothetical protein